MLLLSTVCRTAEGPFRQEHTIASQIVGQLFIWLPMYTLNQAILQRCLAVDNMRKVKLYV